MTLAQDARYALRMMRKAPVFSVTTVMLVALGIGANATVFAAVNAVLLRPLPYQEPGRLVFVRENGPAETSRGMRVGIPDFGDWRAQSSSFTDLAAYAPISFNLAHAGSAERVEAQVVSANFARVLGVAPQLGRFFAEEDDRPGSGHVVVVSDRLWRRVLGARADVLGAVIELNAQPYTIIGVMRESFAAPDAADLWIKVRELRKYEFEKHEVGSLDDEGFEAKWNLGVKCWRVIRKSDGVVMQDNLKTKAECYVWIAAHNKQIAA